MTGSELTIGAAELNAKPGGNRFKRSENVVKGANDLFWFVIERSDVFCLPALEDRHKPLHSGRDSKSKR